MTEITVLKINEYGKLLLTTVTFDEYHEIESQYFNCECCDTDEEIKWHGTHWLHKLKEMNVCYMLQYGGKSKHAIDCCIPVNPHTDLTNTVCQCGFQHHTDHKGMMYVVRYKIDESGSVEYQCCTKDDYDEFMNIMKKNKN